VKDQNPSDTLKRILAERNVDWNSGPLRGNEDQTIRWIKVGYIPSANLTLGLSDTGHWVRGGGATIEVAKSALAITLLPCLEVPVEEFRQVLRKGLCDLGLPCELEEMFPYSDMVVAGLTSRSDYWTKLALDRVEDGVRNQQVENALRSASAFAATQKLRHRAKALLLVKK
jgi:hypothetical protein